MEFFSLKKAPVTSSDVVYRESWLTRLTGSIFWIAVTIVGIWISWKSGSWGVGLFPLLCFLITVVRLNDLRHALHPSNWLLRLQSRGVLIKYRSYLAAGLSHDDEVVVRINFDEFKSAGKTVQRIVRAGTNLYPGPGDASTSRNGVAAFNFTFLDLEMKKNDLVLLRSKLHEERCRKAITRGLMHPVAAADGGVFRLLWRSLDSRITPTIESALDSLSATGKVQIRPPMREGIDQVTDPGTQTGREAAVRQLLESGNRLGAINLAQKYFNCSLEEASEVVEKLATVPPGSPAGIGKGA